MNIIITLSDIMSMYILIALLIGLAISGSIYVILLLYIKIFDKNHIVAKE